MFAVLPRRLMLPAITPGAAGRICQPRLLPARRIASRTLSLVAVLPGVTTTGSAVTFMTGREVQPATTTASSAATRRARIGKEISWVSLEDGECDRWCDGRII